MNSFYRRGPLALAFLFLCGCNSLTATTIETINLAIKGNINEIPIEQVTSVEADSLLIKAGAAEGLYVAQNERQGLVDWVGLDESVQTHNGRLTQLVGVGNDVFAPLIKNDPFLLGLSHVSDGTQVIRTVDFPRAYQTGLQQHATYTKGPLERIEILGQLLPHQRIDEQIWMPQLHYKATNYYWLDPDSGQVRRSIQHVAPDFPALDITVTRLPNTEPPK